MAAPESADPRRTREGPPASHGPAARAGLSLAEYDWRVRDMAKSVVHVPAIYAAAQVAGLTRLLPHPLFQEPGAGLWRELAFFACGFLGAWAVLCSTLLRDAGLRSWTATVTVPLAVVVAVGVWVVLPDAAQMSRAEAGWAAVLLAGPGPIAWLVTARRWRLEKRRVAHLLADAEARP